MVANLFARDFTPRGPHPVWSADITSLGTDAGGRYLAIVLDLFHREVVGCWSLQPRMTADHVGDALTRGWFRRQPAPGLIHPSDRGSPYASQAFQAKRAPYGRVCSMSRKGHGWANGVRSNLLRISIKVLSAGSTGAKTLPTAGWALFTITRRVAATAP